MTRALLIVVMVASVAGCATIQASETRSTEQLLAAAGFHMEVAATPEELAELRMVPARKIVARASPGTTSYVYPDPDGCRCLYVGGEPQYQEYQRLQLKKEIAEEETRATTSSRSWPWWP